MTESPAGRVTITHVNTGQARPLVLGARTVQTGIAKRPVDAISVSSEGISGDTVCDLKHHGGVDQAVYLFSAEDYAWWSIQMSREVPPGSFGDNVTLDAWWEDVRVGDQLHFDSVVLELSFPRIPCGTLSAHIGRRSFVKEYIAARRPGYYARVLTAGTLSPGERARVHRAPSSHPLMLSLFDVWHADDRDPAVLRAALAAPIAERARAAFTQLLGQH